MVTCEIIWRRRRIWAIPNSCWTSALEKSTFEQLPINEKWMTFQFCLSQAMPGSFSENLIFSLHHTDTRTFCNLISLERKHFFFHYGKVLILQVAKNTTVVFISSLCFIYHTCRPVLLIRWVLGEIKVPKMSWHLTFQIKLCTCAKMV